MASSAELPEAEAEGTTQAWTRLSERGSIWGMRFTVACYRVLGRRVALRPWQHRERCPGIGFWLLAPREQLADGVAGYRES